jgi:hypothetical protein
MIIQCVICRGAEVEACQLCCIFMERKVHQGVQGWQMCPCHAFATLCLLWARERKWGGKSLRKGVTLSVYLDHEPLNRESLFHLMVSGVWIDIKEEKQCEIRLCCANQGYDIQVSVSGKVVMMLKWWLIRSLPSPIEQNYVCNKYPWQRMGILLVNKTRGDDLLRMLPSIVDDHILLKPSYRKEVLDPLWDP